MGRAQRVSRIKREMDGAARRKVIVRPRGDDRPVIDLVLLQRRLAEWVASELSGGTKMATMDWPRK